MEDYLQIHHAQYRVCVCVCVHSVQLSSFGKVDSSESSESGLLCYYSEQHEEEQHFAWQLFKLRLTDLNPCLLCRELKLQISNDLL